MWPDRVSNPGPQTYESGALPTALRGPAYNTWCYVSKFKQFHLFILFMPYYLLMNHDK